MLRFATRNAPHSGQILALLAVLGASAACTPTEADPTGAGELGGQEGASGGSGDAGSMDPATDPSTSGPGAEPGPGDPTSAGSAPTGDDPAASDPPGIPTSPDGGAPPRDDPSKSDPAPTDATLSSVDGGSDGGAAPCDLACGDGTCEAVIGRAVCVCPEHVIGDHCELCARGYAGDACGECDDGYMMTPTGACIVDPCTERPCENGACEVTEIGPVCKCDAGFDGADCSECAEGYAGDGCTECTAGYQKEAEACVPVECVDITCTSHGMCMDADGNGEGECVCDEGWSGRDCGSCAEGYLDQDGECIPDVCAGVDCGMGSCSMNDKGQASCHCASHVAGDTCEACDEGYVPDEQGTACVNVLPIRDGLRGWYDAADFASMDTDDLGNVSSWTNKAADNTWLHFAGTTHQPDLVALPPGVHFAAGDYLYSAGATLLEYHDYVFFIVASWDPDPELSPHTLLHGWDTEVEATSLLVQADGADTVTWTHSAPASYVEGDTVSGSFFDAGAGRQLITGQRGPLLDGTAQKLSNGAESATAVAYDGAFERPSMFAVGNALPGSTPFKGVMHEIVLYEGALTAEELASVEAYLRVKWGL